MGPERPGGGRLSAEPLSIAFLIAKPELAGGTKVLVEHARRLAARGHRTSLVVPEGRPVPWTGPPPVRAVPAEARLLVATRYRDLPLAMSLAAGRPVAHLIQGDDTAGPRSVLANARGVFGILARRLARRKLARVARVLALPTRKIAVARHLARRLELAGHPVAIAPTGIDLDRFHPAPGKEIAVRPRVLVSGPRSGCTKGIDRALEALALVRASSPIEVVHLAPGLSETDARADQRLAAIDEEAVAALLRGITVFVSAVTEDEGFDLVALEALASGVACVLGGGGAHAEIAPALVTGREPEALARAIREALDDPAARASRIALGLDAARARSWDRVIETIEQAYAAAALTR